MKYPQSVNKSIFIREVYEDTYKNINEYIVDTMIWENRVDELHTIWKKVKHQRWINFWDLSGKMENEN
jgi:hypothetical protein